MKKTNLRASEKTLEVLFQILDSVEEGINVVDLDGVLIYSNNISGSYVREEPENMIGKHISDYYPQAALINVLKTGKNVNFEKITHDNGNIYNVRAFPIFEDNELIGGYAVFVDITEIIKLNSRIEELEQQTDLMNRDDIFSKIIGWDISLKDTIIKAKKSIGSLGGPRHSIITGESGTGKTMLARGIYEYAKYIGILGEKSPFIEVNCAQYTNPDIAAMEIFGSTSGAYTDAKDKKGLFENANGGILFLDEAHALDSYQNLLLKVIESGLVRRIGGTDDIKVKVIVIAASTRNLKEVLIPELYQRLAQNELFLMPLRDRTDLEKFALMNEFVKEYTKRAMENYDIDLTIEIDEAVQKLLMNGKYPRNIRQFRDIINSAIDSAVPLIRPNIERNIITRVKEKNLPKGLFEIDEYEERPNMDLLDSVIDDNTIDSLILELNKKGFGARRISNILIERNIDVKYYQVAYRLKRLKLNEKV